MCLVFKGFDPNTSNTSNWADWSENILDRYSQTNTLYINSIVYAEVSIGFNKIEELENAIYELGIKVLEIPREALFLTGKVFLKYRKNKGSKNSPLPDFFIGAHATVSKFELITRDPAKYKTYYPQLTLIYNPINDCHLSPPFFTDLHNTIDARVS